MEVEQQEHGHLSWLWALPGSSGGEIRQNCFYAEQNLGGGVLLLHLRAVCS